MNTTTARQHSPALLASSACGALAYFVERTSNRTGRNFFTPVQAEIEIHNMNAGLKHTDVHIMDFLVWAQSTNQEIHIMNAIERMKTGGLDCSQSVPGDRAATEPEAKELEMKS